MTLFEESDTKMAEAHEATCATAGKLGLCLKSCQKVNLTTAPSVPFGKEGIIKVVDHFKYLGDYYSADGTTIK